MDRMCDKHVLITTVITSMFDKHFVFIIAIYYSLMWEFILISFVIWKQHSINQVFSTPFCSSYYSLGEDTHKYNLVYFKMGTTWILHFLKHNILNIHSRKTIFGLERDKRSSNKKKRRKADIATKKLNKYFAIKQMFWLKINNLQGEFILHWTGNT